MSGCSAVVNSDIHHIIVRINVNHAFQNDKKLFRLPQKYSVILRFKDIKKDQTGTMIEQSNGARIVVKILNAFYKEELL